jgi:hypothetical protein
LAIGPINRSIEEEHRVQVLVRDNNVGQWQLATGAAIGPEGMRRARHEFIHCAFI